MGLRGFISPPDMQIFGTPPPPRDFTGSADLFAYIGVILAYLVPEPPPPSQF